MKGLVSTIYVRPQCVPKNQRGKPASRSYCRPVRLLRRTNRTVLATAAVTESGYMRSRSRHAHRSLRRRRRHDHDCGLDGALSLGRGNRCRHHRHQRPHLIGGAVSQLASPQLLRAGREGLVLAAQSGVEVSVTIRYGASPRLSDGALLESGEP